MTKASDGSGKVKAKRSLRFTPTSLTTGILAVTVGGEDDAYLVEEVGSDHGRCFRFDKLSGLKRQGDRYTVTVSGDGQQACQCPGHAYRQTCRHTAAARIIAERGLMGTTGIPGGEDF